ncbi:MAG: tetratricopeptide repeat protein [Planctomycetes bacterium]|nr:tetratricopeptide repeat protein [Planctomycetota bacterium]
MNSTAASIALSVLLSTGAAFGVAYGFHAERGPAPQTVDRVTVEDLEELRAAIEALRETRIPEIAARTAVGEDLDARIEAAVARALRSAGDVVPAAADQGAALNVDAVVVELLETGLDPQSSDAIWDRVKQAGKIDEVIAAFERRAQENPNDADVQADLGEAYIRKIMEATTTMEQGAAATHADAAYDRALALDSTHWRARFNKAVSYSFWPPITGKPQEAVEHFKTLLTQQEANPAGDNGGFFRTYVMLGNLYSQRGETDEARAVWQRGLDRHPDSQALRAKLR